MNLLMLIAHPDDEIIFGFHDIYHNKCTVLCFTNKNNSKRSQEFYKSIESTNNIGIMFDLPDSMTNNWKKLTDEYIYESYIKLIICGSFDAVISHDINGEYGHIQHKRVNKIGIYVAKILNIPFYDFKSRYDPKDYEDINYVTKRNDIFQIYKSQQYSIKLFANFFNIL